MQSSTTCRVLPLPLAAVSESLPLLNLHASRAEVLAYFKNTWALTEMLFTGLASEEAFYRRPYHQLRHPMIFYYGHPVALYVNKLRLAGLFEGPVDAELEKLFETGVDEMRWDDLHEGSQHIWPKLERVRAYRAQVYAMICELIETHPLLEEQHLPVTQASPFWALVMGFEHERIHLETSSVLMRELPIEFVRKPAAWPDYAAMQQNASAVPAEGKDYPANAMIDVAATQVQLGKPQSWPSFGWDNEYGYERRDVMPFRASRALISNGEFHRFVASGGYAEEKYWGKQGWAWRRFRNTKWPSFWLPDGPAGLHQYRLRTVFEIIPMQWDWPVCVNYHEAKAYAAWASERDNASYRLLYEAEHNALRDAALQQHTIDPVMEGASAYNFNLNTGAESPVNAYPANDKGFHDTLGNVWQWCEDAFQPLEGFKVHPFYDDFSTPCYDNEHQMILGGSFISTGDEASIFARFHFRPHFFQHAGFRLAEGEVAARLKGNAVYETGTMVDRYMLMHWGEQAEICDPALGPVFPQAAHLPLICAELVAKYAPSFDRALDLGCAVGRSSFELARKFTHVTGIDYSKEFINAASALRATGELTYQRRDQGEQFTDLTAHVDSAIDRTRLTFRQGDACALPDDLFSFDAVLMANVLCRLPDPALALRRMQGEHGLVKQGGVLVMTTPFSWLEEYTPKDKWLRGIGDIQRILTEFELVHEQEIPFLFREHRRKFEYIITKASVWRRR